MSSIYNKLGSYLTIEDCIGQARRETAQLISPGTAWEYFANWEDFCRPSSYMIRSKVEQLLVNNYLPSFYKDWHTNYSISPFEMLKWCKSDVHTERCLYPQYVGLLSICLKLASNKSTIELVLDRLVRWHIIIPAMDDFDHRCIGEILVQNGKMSHPLISLISENYNSLIADEYFEQVTKLMC